jgi:heme-degrading monooxygenase HmoA
VRGDRLATSIPGYDQIPGNLGVYMLRRAIGERCEFVMLTFWESLEAVKAFAGDDHETTAFYPENDRFLVAREERASHVEVAAALPPRV